MEIKIKKLREDAIIPRKATKGSAAYDVCIPEDVRIERGRQVVKLGFAIELPYGYEAKIEPRSGFSSKGMEGYDYEFSAEREKKYRFNADVLVGKIDSDYRGDVGVIIKNNEPWHFYLGKGTRIAQLTIYKVEDAEFEEVEELSETDRADGGFGHTGSKI